MTCAHDNPLAMVVIHDGEVFCTECHRACGRCGAGFDRTVNHSGYCKQCQAIFKDAARKYKEQRP
jgi:hypothetical protein